MALGVLALAVLEYQLPRWAQGLDPTFVHPKWLERSSFPILLKFAAIHPGIWIGLVIVAFARICQNWRLKK